MADTGVPVAARPLRRRGKSERLDRLEDFFQDHADLEAGQVRAEAEVDAVAEGQVRVGVALYEERVRFVEAPRIPVGRALPDYDLLPGADARATQLAPGGRGPALGGRRCRPTQDLLHRGVHRHLPGPQKAQLLGPFEEGQNRPGAGRAGRLAGGGEQQREEGRELVVAQRWWVGVSELGVDHGREHVGTRESTLLADELRSVLV